MLGDLKGMFLAFMLVVVIGKMCFQAAASSSSNQPMVSVGAALI